MQIHLKIDPNVLTLDDLIAFEESGTTIRGLREMLMRFATNGDGQPLPEGEARKLIGKMTVKEVRQTVERFTEAVKELQATAVPPTTPAA